MNLNLAIPAGQRLGICGRTGSGKSTLAMSLFRVVDIVGGRITIDDVDISTIHSDEIRTRLSIIPQDVMLFNGTIRENLDPRGHYTDLDLLNSLEMAQLKPAIVSLPLGLDTAIVDNGNSIFSCGEKQLFCLARAVLRGSVCLVLDEATSSLDGETEIQLLETASRAFHGRTIITIAVSAPGPCESPFSLRLSPFLPSTGSPHCSTTTGSSSWRTAKSSRTAHRKSCE